MKIMVQKQLSSQTRDFCSLCIRGDNYFSSTKVCICISTLLALFPRFLILAGVQVETAEICSMLLTSGLFVAGLENK